MKVLVLGNSGILLREERGIEIDQFDIIVRTNQFKIAGYERYVGTRTDIACVISSKVGGRQIKDGQTQENLGSAKTLWCSRPERVSTSGIRSISRKFPELARNPVYPDPQLFENLRDHYLLFSGKRLHPGTGTVAIRMAMDIFPNDDIYIAGFSQWAGGYYWDQDKKIKSRHAKQVDTDLIEAWLRAGKIHMFGNYHNIAVSGPRGESWAQKVPII